MKYKAIIFDLDGTLHFPSEDLVLDVRKNIDTFLQSKGLTKSYEESINLLELIQNHYASIELGLNVLFGINALDFIKAVFTNLTIDKVVKSDLSLLNKLQKLRIKKVVFNGATRAYCTAVLSQLGILRAFDRVFSSEDVPAIKSSVAALLFIAAELDLPPSEILLVGDNPKQDILPAQLAGFQTLCVTPELSKDGKFLDLIYTQLLEAGHDKL